MKYFVSCGEASGDLHLSYIVKSIKKNYQNIEFYGVAGEKSQAVGVKILQNIDELAIMGFFEVLKKYNFLKNKAKEYINFIKNNEIKNIILIDYGGFNLKFLELLKKEQIDVKIFYYIPPKVWIWGEKRIEKIKLVDHIVVIFPWEVEFYKKHNIDVIYFGNPFTDIYGIIEKKGDKILLLPGSRKQEITKILPIFLELVREEKNKEFIVKLNSKEDLKYTKKFENVKNVKIEVEKKLNEVCEECKIAIATSGTVILELALLGLATIVVYKTSFINYFIAKTFLKIKYISLPNITMDTEIFPELIQEKCNIINIKEKLNFLLENEKETEKNIKKTREKLAGNSVIDSYANFFIKEGK